MANSSRAKTSRTKQFRSKVKTGCITCKIRRIKCDENKPHCKRCTSTGRRCDGYAPPKATPQIVTASSLSLIRTGTCITQISGSSEEGRSLEFYFKRAAPKISGLLGNDFWFKLVYQIGYAEPAVRHALTAIGYLYEKESSAHAAGHRALPAHGEDKFLLRQYNRAISCLVERMSNESNLSSVSVVTCLLFVCLESLMQRADECYTHLLNGLGVLHAMRGRGIYHPQSVSLRHGNTDEIHISRRIQRTKAPDADLLDETLVPLFARLNVGAVISGHHASDVSCTDPAAVRAFPTSFTSIEEAWQELVKLLHHALKFVLQASSKRYSRTFTTEDLAFHSHLLSQMAHWLRLVKDFERNNDKEDLSENTLLCSARLQHQCAWIWLSCCTDPLEMKYDNYMDGFREIFSIGKVLVSNSLLRTPDSEFDFAYDLEYVAPLFFGAMKCRDPILRRHFVQLLDRRKRWESIWDSERCACMARRLIALEESGLCGSSVHKYPPARYRIHEHQMSIDRPSFKATFHSLPSGLGSELYTWVETWHI